MAEIFVVATLCLSIAISHGEPEATKSEHRELIADNQFRHGFVLWETKPGKHVRYGEMPGLSTNSIPAWGLLQWSSKHPLDPTTLLRLNARSLVCSNQAKGVILGMADADVSMSVNTAVEYGDRARLAGAPWVHLLAEQEFDPPASLQPMQAARLHVEARLTRSHNLHKNDYSPSIHAAQFQIFFTVQNRNRQSLGHGDLLWFGVPIYDNRDRFPNAFKEQDFGGTAQFIFTPEGKTFSSSSAHDGQWVVIEKDLLPLMRGRSKARGLAASSRIPRTFVIIA